jgi:hypothetical protein
MFLFKIYLKSFLWKLKQGQYHYFSICPWISHLIFSDPCNTQAYNLLELFAGVGFILKSTFFLSRLATKFLYLFKQDAVFSCIHKHVALISALVLSMEYHAHSRCDHGNGKPYFILHWFHFPEQVLSLDTHFLAVCFPTNKWIPTFPWSLCHSQINLYFPYHSVSSLDQTFNI